jgi:phosphoserine aminotransferase
MPVPVLEKAAREMVEHGKNGMSVMEMSHRSKMFEEIIGAAEANLRSLMSIPDNYKVLFLHGGASAQFAAVPMNLLKNSADYALTGNFSTRAYEEAVKYGDVKIAVNTKSENFVRIPEQKELVLNPNADYFHMCFNNTIYGTKWNYIPDTGKVPIVADMSSCILSEPVDVSKFGVIYAGVQKNMGPAGMAVVIIREDLVKEPMGITPTIWDYPVEVKNQSMLNTPPAYIIYITKLVVEWVKSMGGLEAMKQHNEAKAKILFDYLDESKLFKPAALPGSRSMMNVTFVTGDAALDKEFVKTAEANGLVTIAGHRSVGGMRASIYNAMPVEGVKKLVEVMAAFEASHK